MSSLNKSIKKEAYKLIFWQLSVIVGLALVLFLLQGLRNSLSALLGGLAYCLPNFVFVWRVFARTSAREAQRFVIAFFAGEATKLILSAALFLFIVKFLPVHFAPVLGGYVAAIVAFWVVASVHLSKQSRRS